MSVAIIPARGGSKRIPRKNIVDFCGKPLIAHSIETARSSGLFERVIVSTDDDEIADVARRYGADVPFVRPAELSDDHTGTAAVMSHAVSWLDMQGATEESVCCLYATAVLTRVEDLQQGHKLLGSGKWNYVFSATTFDFSVFRGFTITNGTIEMIFPQHRETRSQDLPDAFHDAGQFYWASPSTWLAKLPIFAPGSAVVNLPSWRVQDIDTYEDLERARLIFAALA